MVDWNIGIAVACEPYYVPPNSSWSGDINGSVAVVVGSVPGPPFSLLETGPGLVVARWGEYVVVGAYFSPNRSLAEFEAFLDSVGAAIRRQASGKVIFLGDLNAKSAAWGNHATDARGRVVQDWSLLSGLSLLNRGTDATCVRQQGSSVVDVSFATPAVARRDREPWGRPYRVARNKLCAASAPVMESLQPDLFCRLVGELFPETTGHTPPVMTPR